MLRLLAFSDFLTFKGGLNPVTGSLWMTDVSHHHLAFGVIAIIGGHMYRTNYGIGHSMKEILDSQQGDPILFPARLSEVMLQSGSLSVSAKATAPASPMLLLSRSSVLSSVQAASLFNSSGVNPPIIFR